MMTAIVRERKEEKTGKLIVTAHKTHSMRTISLLGSKFLYGWNELVGMISS